MPVTLGRKHFSVGGGGGCLLVFVGLFCYCWSFLLLLDVAGFCCCCFCSFIVGVGCCSLLLSVFCRKTIMKPLINHQ